MNTPLLNAFLGFICTVGFFVLSLFIVAGGKLIFLSVKERFFPKKIPTPTVPKTTVVKRAKKPTTIRKPVRSIEIDPEQVDRIYVKKIS